MPIIEATEFLKGDETWKGIERRSARAYSHLFFGSLLDLTMNHLRAIKQKKEGIIPPGYLPVLAYPGMKSYIELEAKNWVTKSDKPILATIGGIEVPADIFYSHGEEFLARPVEGIHMGAFFGRFSEGSPTSVLRVQALLTPSDANYRRERGIARIPMQGIVVPPSYSPGLAQAS